MTLEEIFLFRLASHLKITVSTVLQMSPTEYEGWILYSEIEPFGDELKQSWQQAGTIARNIFQVNETKNKTWKNEDFIPTFFQYKKNNSNVESKLKAFANMQMELKKQQEEQSQQEI